MNGYSIASMEPEEPVLSSSIMHRHIRSPKSSDLTPLALKLHMETTNLLQTSLDAENIAHTESWSKYTKLLCWIILPAVPALLLYISPVTALSLPILLIPAALLLWHEANIEGHKRANIEVWIWTFFLNATVMMALAGTVQAILCYGFALLLFGPETDKYLEEFARKDVDSLTPEQKAMRQQMSQKLAYWVLIAISSLCVFSAVEESTRYITLVCLRRFKALIHERHYLTYIIAAAVGFSTFENIGFVYTSSQVDTASRLALTVFERVAICTPATMVGAGLIGVNTMRRDVRKERLNLVQILGLSVGFHGLFDFMLMAISALNGNVGWVHPRDAFSTALAFVMAMAIVFTAAIILQQRLSRCQSG